MIKKSLLIAAVVVVMPLLVSMSGPVKVGSDDFYAYYTRLDYTPEGTSGPFFMRRDYPLLKREPKIRPGRWKGEPLTGRYPDIIVNVGQKGQLVFCRESGYLPYWQTGEKKWPLKEIVERLDDPLNFYSYVRIIENEKDIVLVHWRYYPRPQKNMTTGEIENTAPTDVVHEYFVIMPDGRVVRSVRAGRKRLADFANDGNVIQQFIELGKSGIKQVSLRKGNIERIEKPVKGSDIKTSSVAKPVAHWRFDEGIKLRGDIATENIGEIDCVVEGNKALWKKGVSGTAAAFDGYFSKVTLPFPEAPKVSEAVTVEAWIAIGAYPWNDAPVVHHSYRPDAKLRAKKKSGEEGKFGYRTGNLREGYYLGIGPYGHAVFKVNDKTIGGWQESHESVRSPGMNKTERIPTNRWTHLAGVYGNGKMTLYVDGEKAACYAASGEVELPDTGLAIGLNTAKGRATDTVRSTNRNIPSIFGFEGLIDEVKIYDRALSSSEIAQSFADLKPPVRLRDNPDLEPRILPGRPAQADKFGASYEKLKFHDLWDNIWRTSPWPDIVVKFDENPGSVVYWRGTNFGAGWVTENNKWLSGQSKEINSTFGCSEHMADKLLRHCHVRLIENTPARVVIHWRYSCADVGYVFRHSRSWTDEYHTIYPDAAGVRYVNYRGGGSGNWHDMQLLSQPGTGALDNVHSQAATVANLNGEVEKLTWTGPNGVPESELVGACIKMVNFKSKYKVFVISQDNKRSWQWGDDEQSPYTKDAFAGPWDHWPISLIPSDGKYTIAEPTDRVTHAAIGGLKVGDKAIFGLTDKSAASLVPLAKSWQNPPQVTNAVGLADCAYKRQERAYHLAADAPSVSFTLAASKDSPVYNPCFVIKNLKSATAKAAVKVNGETVKLGKNFRQGTTRDTDGKPVKIIWLRYHSQKPTGFEIFKK